MKPNWIVILSATLLVAASFSAAVLEGARTAEAAASGEAVQVAAR